ncbi:MAG: DUF5522 domain-containing protein [Saprospiraceae bacterium]
MGALIEGKDYYLENGRWVFTGHYLRVRGYCCKSGCRHCPYQTGQQAEQAVAEEPAEETAPRRFIPDTPPADGAQSASCL